MRNLILSCFVFISWVACKKTEVDNSPNPYNDWEYDIPKDKDSLQNPAANSIAGLYATIFKPSCANSGCHDGNFEPDFRTIESSYNSLVNRSVIKQDSLSEFEYRVVAGNADKSMLIQRLTIDLNGNSGIMPLSIDPNSDWIEKKEEYIKNIRDWINQGAKDILGNSITPVDLKPTLKGFVVCEKGTTIPLPRSGAFGPVIIPSGVSDIDIWFAFEDDNSNSLNLQYNKVKFHINLADLNNAVEYGLNVSNGPTFIGLDNKSYNFTHKITLKTNEIGTQGDVIWFRAYVQDASNGILEYPSENSIFRLKTYCTIKL